jgi:hypothetical protein
MTIPQKIAANFFFVPRIDSIYGGVRKTSKKWGHRKVAYLVRSQPFNQIDWL